MERLQRLARALDGYQQRHRWLALPVAVVKKFGDDQASTPRCWPTTGSSRCSRCCWSP
jgi:hypothetical protein